MFKKIIYPSIAALLAVITLGASVGVALARPISGVIEGCQTETIKVGQKVDLSSGRVSVTMPASSYNGELVVCHDNQTPNVGAQNNGLTFMSPAMYWTVKKSQKINARFNHGNAFVVFDLTSAQETAWRAGGMSIYHWDQPTTAWIKLPTSHVHGSELTAKATGFGYYALAVEASTK